MTRWLSAAVLALSACFGASAATADSAEDAAARANRSAYEIAMKCFVVNGMASGDYQKKHDTEMTALYDNKAHASFNVALKLGYALGYSNDRVSADFDLAQTRELPRLVSDLDYYKSAVASCKAVGLM